MRNSRLPGTRLAALLTALAAIACCASCTSRSKDAQHAALVWAPPSQRGDEAISAARAADLVIFVGGLNPRVEGEEMKMTADGFAGGDRTSLDLPAPQQDLLQRLQATGKPVVFVLMSGSALSINWADRHIPAIIEAWYPGEEGGT